MDYTHLLGTQGDYERGISTYYQETEPWNLKNNLPIVVWVYLQKANTSTKELFVKLQPNKGVNVPFTMLSAGDNIHTYFELNPTLLGVLMEPYTLVGYAKTVEIGSVTYTSLEGRIGYSLNKDISGVWLVNKFGIPIDIYQDSRRVVHLQPDDHLENLGGSNSVALYRGLMGNGVNFGDELEIRFSYPDNTQKKVFTVTIKDINCQKMFIGVTSAGYLDPRAGYNNIYRVT